MNPLDFKLTAVDLLATVVVFDECEDFMITRQLPDLLLLKNFSKT